jgi:uridine phosphorylase
MPLHFSDTDLIINPDGSSYHLNIRPEQIPDTIILVGDPDRVELVSRYFDQITAKVHKREFVSHFGKLNHKDIAVISSGIGPDNVEIVMTELDALVNIDFSTRQEKTTKRRLNLIRIGTSGSIQENVPVDSYLLSNSAIGLDNLAFFYGFKSQINDFNRKDLDIFEENLPAGMSIYAVKCSEKLAHFFFNHPEFQQLISGMTLTTPGFYAPQGRQMRINLPYPHFLNEISSIYLSGQSCSNMEMETATYYAFAKLLGHEMISLNAILANRKTNVFSKNPEKQVDTLIQMTLKVLRES